MRKFLLMTVAALLAISAGAQETIKIIRVYEGNTVVFEQKYDAVDSVVFVDINGFVYSDFSVSATAKVQFSHGNLQYQASTNTWRFAENQWDIIDSDNSNISSTYTGWIDLFGWGTGNNPTNTSKNNSDYSTFTDWGINPISNGGNAANQWRTLTKDEWVYLFHGRANAEQLFSYGLVNDVPGVILLPDDWTTPEGVNFVTSDDIGLVWEDSYSLYYNGYYTYGNTNLYERNTYTVVEWLLMEQAGAVFLPAAGVRFQWGMSNALFTGNYWSSTPYDDSSANYLYYRVGRHNISEELHPQGNFGSDDGVRINGYSVRLVR